MKKNKMLFMLILLIFCVTFFHGYPKTYKTNIYNDIKMASNTTSVKITYKSGSGSGSDYGTTVTPTTKNYADNVAVLIKNNGVTNYTHSDVTKSINGVSKSYQMILTGWKLVSVVQNGTTISTFEEPEHYNYADRTNAKKDIGTVYAEEGYYYVPDGVTEVTFEAVYGWAIYVKDPYTKMVYDTNYWFNTDASIASGRTGSADSNYGTNTTTDVVASLKRAYELIDLSGETTSSYTMYDHVIVLEGPLTDVRATAGSQPSTCHTDTYDGKTISTCNSRSNTNWGYSTKDVAVTITSDDSATTQYELNVKAYTYWYYIYGDLRLDNIRWKAASAVSGGVSKADPRFEGKKGNYLNEFSTTERLTTSYTLFYETNTSVKFLRFMGGATRTNFSNGPVSGTNDLSNFKYVLVGGKTTGFIYTMTGMGEWSTVVGTVNNPPTLNVIGGSLSTIYLAGYTVTSSVGTTRSDGTVYMYATGGLFNSNIYASGVSSLKSSAYIDLDGITLNGTLYGGGKSSYATVSGDVTINLKNSTVKNIYGGPEYGDVLGNTTLNIYNTTINGNLYGGGYGATSSNTTRLTGEGSATKETIAAVLNTVDHCSSDGMTCYNSAGTSLPNIKKINNQYRYYFTSSTADKYVSNDTKNLLGFYNSDKNFILTRFYLGGGIELTSITHYPYHIISSLSAATVNDLNISVEKCTINGDVYGGGNRGSVNGNINFKIKNTTITGRVYGGGYTVTDNLVNIYHRQYSFYNKPYTYFNSGNVLAYQSESGNYFVGTTAQGGVNRYDSFKWKDYNYLLTNSSSWTSEDKSNYESIWGSGKASSAEVINGIDYVNKVVYSATANKMGTVYGNSTITIDNTKVAKNVYGGGYAGISEGNSTINITNGSIISGHVYAGAYSSKVGGKATITLDSQSTITGNLYGGGEGSTSTVANSELNISGRVNGSVYGGSYAGKVTGTSTVNLKSGGVVANDLFGGGYGETSQSLDSVVNIAGTVTKSVYGGSFAGKVTGTSTINVNTGGKVTGSVYGGGYGENSTLQTGNTNITGTVVGSIYGGSYAGKVTGNTTITVNSGANVGENIYGGGYGTTSTTSNNIIKISGTASKSVYGGSYAGKVTGSSNITVNSGGKVTNNVFGAGEGATSVIKDTIVNISGIVGKNVYGGSDLGIVGNGTIDGVNNSATISTAGSSTVNINSGAQVGESVYGAGNGAADGEASMHIEYGALFGKSTVNVTGGTVNGNLYGGGNRSRAFSSGSSNAVEIKVDGSTNSIVIKGAVFGGGNSAGDSGVNASVHTVIGNTHVQIVDSTTKDNINILGGIYGGGNLCLVKGSKTVEISNMGSVSEIAIKTLQRSDSVTLNNSNIHIDSARDVVNEFDTNEYSINRVANLYFKNGSKVTINKTVNYLGNIISDDSSSSNVDNYLCINNGLLTKIEKEDNTYGKVEGYFKLGLSNYATGEGGGFLFANENSTGNFISADSSQNIINNTFTGNYKFWYLEGTKYIYDLKVTGYTKAANSYVVELPLIQLYGKKFNLTLKSSSYSDNFKSYIQNNPYIDVIVGYKDATVSAINLTSQKAIYKETTIDSKTLPTLLLELKINSTNLENTISDEVITLEVSDGTSTYIINLKIDIAEQIIENSVFTNSGKWYNGIALSDSINVSSNSSYSAQFLTTYVPRLYSDIELTLETTTKFYKGTKITMIDNTDENNTYYYYYIVSSDTNKINLTDFRKMGTIDQYFEPYFSNRSINENFNFIIDMADSNTTVGNGVIMIGHYSNDMEILNNTASREYKISDSTHPTINVELHNYGKDYYNFKLNINGSNNASIIDTEATSQYLLEIRHQDNSNFDFGTYVEINNSIYLPTSGNQSILIPIDLGDYSLKYKTMENSMGKDLVFHIYYGTNNLKSSSIISQCLFDVPNKVNYTFGILDSMNRVIELDATKISIPITYQNLNDAVVTVQLQEKSINSDGTYSYTTLKDYLVGDNSDGIKIISLSNSIDLNLENGKLKNFTTYNLLFTISDKKGYKFTDEIEIVVK